MVLITYLNPVFMLRGLPTLQLALILKTVKKFPNFRDTQDRDFLVINYRIKFYTNNLRLIDTNVEKMSVRSI
jgi:hypothetical protein